MGAYCDLLDFFVAVRDVFGNQESRNYPLSRGGKNDTQLTIWNRRKIVQAVSEAYLGAIRFQIQTYT